ncbi:MAG: hypothetical protein KDD46_05215 [Bdellovibrionales bacterium]|nr:hypothetical protein [Bdellovibrionales bacterium]
MSKYKLIYFNSCPNYQAAVDLLNQSGLEFEAVCQDDLEEGDLLKNYSSPTLLDGERIIFGSEAKGGGCSIPLPKKEELLKILN